MNTKYLLLGSATLFVAMTSGAQAADMAIAAEPTTTNYVETCDMFGAGYFYIPGTETCLQLDGYVRLEAKAGGIQTGSATDGDWYPYTKVNLEIIAKTDTELGVLTSNFTPEFYAYSKDSDSSFYLDQAYMEIGSALKVRAGYIKGYWNQDLYGELDNVDNISRYNAIRIGYYGIQNFEAALELDALPTDYTNTSTTKLGLSARLGYVVSDQQYAKLDLGYDTSSETYAIRPWMGFGIGPGTFEIAGVATNGFISYVPDFTGSNWNDSPIANTYMKYAVAADYYFTVADALTIAPQTQYNVAGNDKTFWQAGAVLDWAVVDDLHVRLNANYAFLDKDWNQQNWFGWLRLERDF